MTKLQEAPTANAATPNPGDAHAKDMFPGKEGGGGQSDNTGSNPGDNIGRDLQQLENYANDPANHSSPSTNGDSTNPSANIQSTQAAEQNNSNWENNYRGNAQKDKVKWKRYKPIAAIIAVIGGGGVTTLLLGPTTLLLPTVANVMLNDGDDSYASSKIRSEAVLGHKIGIKGDPCTNANSLRCKKNTMSKQTTDKLKTEGYKIEGDPKGDRTLVRSITTPDNRPIRNSAELGQAMKDDPKVGSVFSRVFSGSKTYFSATFKKALGKLGLSKAPRVTGNTREETRESFRRSMGLVDATGGDGQLLKPALELGNKISSAARGSSGPEAACAYYGFSRGLLATMAIINGRTAALFAMAFLVMAHQIMASEASPEAAGALSKQLTDTDQREIVDGQPNPEYNKSATDAEAFKIAMYGDGGGLPAYAAGFLLGGSAFLGFVKKGVEAVDSVTGSKRVTKLICKVAHVIGMAQCIGGVALAVCAAIITTLPFILAPIIEQAMKALIEIAKQSDLDETIIGSKAMNYIGVGVGVIMGKLSQGFGMRPASKGEFQAYLAYTDPVRKQAIEIARYDARSEPFNIYNQYSFLGSLASNLNLATFSRTSIVTNIANLYSMIPKSFASVTTASAGLYMPTNPYNASRFESCPQNTNLTSIGVSPDEKCQPRYVSTAPVLSKNTGSNLEYMINNGHIDDNDPTRAPKSDDYKKFLEYCGVEREAPMGMTTKGIEEGDMGDEDWFSGKKCREDGEMFDNFHTFSIDAPIEDMLDQGSNVAAYNSSILSDSIVSMARAAAL